MHIGIIDMDVLVYRSLAKQMKEGGDVIQVFDTLLEKIEQDAACEKYSYHLSGTGNFRKNLKQGFTKYKGKRSSKPPLYNFLRDYIAKQYDCITVPLFEADDTAAIEATNIDKTDDIYTFITVDKDWQQKGGLWYNISYGSLKYVSLEDGIRFFHRQLLIGDTVDNIPGLWKVGKVKAEKFLANKTLLEEINTIEELYKKDYKENDYYDVLSAMGTMLWLKRSYDEPNWTPDTHREYLSGL